VRRMKDVYPRLSTWSPGVVELDWLVSHRSPLAEAAAALPGPSVAKA